MKKALSAILSLALVFSICVPSIALADALGSPQDFTVDSYREDAGAFSGGGELDDDVDLSSNELDETPGDDSSASAVDAPVDSTSTIEQIEKTESESDTLKQEIPDIGLVYVENAVAMLGDRQNIVLLFEDDAYLFDGSVALELIGDEGSTFTIDSSESIAGAVLFSFECDEWMGTGSYYVSNVIFGDSEGSETVVSLDNEGTACSFDLVDSIEVAKASDGTVSTETTVIGSEEALDGSVAAPKVRSMSADSKNEFVIAIDPGHGGYDSGATANGLKESDLTWKIAKACVDELNGYENVTAVMTRSQNEDLPGLDDRVDRAVEAGAAAIVSIHINSADASSAHGAEVWYPNDSSWKNEDVHVMGEDLAQSILDRITALGLSDRGIKTLTGDWGESYSDGSDVDYYGILRYARKAGIPGIIVEHAFITNSSDASKLANDSFLKKLGIADAEGIADAYGLNKGSWVADGDKWKYKYEGAYAKNRWLRIGGLWYRFDANGYALTDSWATINGHTYRFGPDGHMLSSEWVKVDGTWYHLSGEGYRQTGWIKLSGKWYYLDPSSGAMATGWAKVGGKWYWMNSSGAMQTGWVKPGAVWYHLSSSGAMDTGWIKPGKVWYYLDPSSGAMATGWKLIGTEWHYFNASGAWDSSKTRAGLYDIMGKSSVSADDLAEAYRKSGASYPASELSKGGAADIDKFCQILYTQATSEGVRPEVVFAQAMLETGWLRFGGDVKASQFNFAGLGAVGGGAAGESFDSVTEGLLAQTQHLKAYASTEELNQPCVDTRFSYVTRGCAPYVECLGKGANPSGVGWATSANYGLDICILMWTYLDV